MLATSGISRLLALAGLGLVGVVPGHASAAPAPIGCGSVIKKSIVLQADLTNCPGDGLVVGAAGITIDLHGHRIEGAVDVGIPVTPGSVGIRNAGYPRVRIEDTTTDSIPVTYGGLGWISGFEVGILITDASRNTILNVVNFDGLRLERSDRATIRASELENTDLTCMPLTSTAALYLIDSDRATIRGNEVQLGGLGMVLIRSHNNVVQGNLVAGVGSDGNNCTGITLLDADGNRLVGNDTSENGGDGIFVDAASQRTVIDGNYAEFNFDDAIDVENKTTTILNTRSVFSRDLGIEAVPGVTASGNVAANNGNPLQCLNVVCT